MAFGAKQIFPLDTQPSVGVGVNLNFNAPGVFKTTYTTQESIKYNLINFLLTNQTERYLTPNFGASLNKFVFQQITDQNDDYLKQDIQSLIGTYFPNVTIESIEILKSPDYNQIDIILKYIIKNTSIEDTLQLSFI